MTSPSPGLQEVKEIICVKCNGIFSRDKNHTCTCHELTNKGVKPFTAREIVQRLIDENIIELGYLGEIKEDKDELKERFITLEQEGVKINNSDKVWREWIAEHTITKSSLASIRERIEKGCNKLLSVQLNGDLKYYCGDKDCPVKPYCVTCQGKKDVLDEIEGKRK